MSRLRVFDWQKRFFDGHDEVEDKHRVDCPRSLKTNDNISKK